MSIRIITSGRTDVDDYFRLSGIREQRVLKHTPFLVFIVHDDTVDVRIVDKPKDLLSYPDETQVMTQWAGQWRSDFFQFTVGQFRQYITEHPAQSYHVV
jgi:hypothetical protein